MGNGTKEFSRANGKIKKVNGIASPIIVAIKYNGFVWNYKVGTGFLDSTLLSKNKSLFQFKRGVEEARKFQPRNRN